jgi:hypothetical protein
MRKKELKWSIFLAFVLLVDGKRTSFADATPHTASHSTRDLIAELIHGINVLDECPLREETKTGLKSSSWRRL